MLLAITAFATSKLSIIMGVSDRSVERSIKTNRHDPQDLVEYAIRTQAYIILHDLRDINRDSKEYSAVFYTWKTGLRLG